MYRACRHEHEMNTWVRIVHSNLEGLQYMATITQVVSCNFHNDLKVHVHSNLEGLQYMEYVQLARTRILLKTNK